uniref:Uncharacterized protein n=1 Tax=Picea glauca TaxID=3330 RepID=A0A101LY78_PICGL|nr:hypothetical protein ABT39_MTgene5718 [Picea glauca]
MVEYRQWITTYLPGSPASNLDLVLTFGFPIDNLVNVPCVATSPSWSGTLEENEKVSKSGVVLSPTTTNMDSTGF